MKAAMISSFGGPDVITTGELSLPSLQPDAVHIRIESAGLNPLDVKMIAGYLQQVFPVTHPYVPGTDFSGVIVAVGAQVQHLQVGERVYGRTSPVVGGAFASELMIAATEVCPIPADMSFEQAASLPTTFGTAHQALFAVGELAAGERVLVHAAAGGVGNMAVQLARQAGAHVIATASERNVELVKSLGAHEVIDYRTQDFSALRDIDLVLDPLGGETLEKSWAVLRAGGRIASLVEFGIQDRDGKIGRSVFFVSAAPTLALAVVHFQAGQLQIIIDSVYPLAEARAALEKQATGHARGKVLIRPPG